ncbi:MAG TPA: hypothetical protein VFS33_01455 [Gemmatimonadales bacterium]|nr:hypothetical protein [Gemmatimonadales bacterium]
MTGTASPSRPSAPALPLAARLRRVHDRWLREVGAQLEPVTVASTSSVWDRWGAARYLADQFNYHFHTAGMLLQQLGPKLASAVVARLAAERAALERMRDELSVLGRRQGTAAPMAVLARALIERLTRWCADLETATDDLAADELEDEARVLLARFEAAPATS